MIQIENNKKYTKFKTVGSGLMFNEVFKKLKLILLLRNLIYICIYIVIYISIRKYEIN